MYRWVHRPPPSIRDIRRILAAHPGRLRSGVTVALRHSASLKAQARELDLLIARGQDLLDFCGTATPSWPPLALPIRPPTLHEAMTIVLEAGDNAWMFSRDLAFEIARRGLYRRRDGLPATARDIAARACAYPDLFERSRYVLRLRRRPSDQDADQDADPDPDVDSDLP